MHKGRQSMTFFAKPTAFSLEVSKIQGFYKKQKQDLTYCADHFHDKTEVSRVTVYWCGRDV